MYFCRLAFLSTITTSILLNAPARAQPVDGDPAIHAHMPGVHGDPAIHAHMPGIPKVGDDEETMDKIIGGIDEGSMDEILEGFDVQTELSKKYDKAPDASYKPQVQPACAPPPYLQVLELTQFPAYRCLPETKNVEHGGHLYTVYEASGHGMNMAMCQKMTAGGKLYKEFLPEGMKDFVVLIVAVGVPQTLLSGSGNKLLSRCKYVWEKPWNHEPVPCNFVITEQHVKSRVAARVSVEQPPVHGHGQPGPILPKTPSDPPTPPPKTTNPKRRLSRTPPPLPPPKRARIDHTSNEPTHHEA